MLVVYIFAEVDQNSIIWKLGDMKRHLWELTQFESGGQGLFKDSRWNCLIVFKNGCDSCRNDRLYKIYLGIRYSYITIHISSNVILVFHLTQNIESTLSFFIYLPASLNLWCIGIIKHLFYFSDRTKLGNKNRLFVSMVETFMRQEILAKSLF